MSHYTVIRTKFTDVQCLRQALADLGYGQIEEGKGLPLYGYQGDRRPQTAEIVVRRCFVGAASNDLGFAWAGDHFDAIISEYDVRQLGPQFVPRLTQRYAYRKMMAAVERRGLTVIEEGQTQDQTIRVVVRQWS